MILNKNLYLFLYYYNKVKEKLTNVAIKPDSQSGLGYAAISYIILHYNAVNCYSQT